MKISKKIVALFLAVLLVVGLSTTVFAAKITISESGKYNAYKLLNAAESETQAGLFVYTVNEKYRTILQSVTGKTTDTDIYGYISELSSDGIRTFADTVYAQITAATLAADKAVENSNVLDNIDQGYWLIVDVKNYADTYDARSLVMLDTAGINELNVNVKKDVPAMTKKIVEGENEVDVTDANIADVIDYRLIGTLPSNIKEFESYSYKFVDTMNNLTYVGDSAAVYIGADDVTDSFTVTFTNKVLTVTCEDILALGKTITANTVIKVEYKATLDATAVIGGAGNPNTAYLQYSNDPYQGKTGTMGKTPEDTTKVFTFALQPKKIDAYTKEALTSAEFNLYRMNQSGAKEYAILTGSKISGWSEDDSKASSIVSGDGGLLTVEGIDAGTYFLEETVAPANYNKLEDPIEVVVAATYQSGAIDTFTATVDGEDATANPATGVVTFEIANNSGSVLPSTGGIGTTIFYVIGGVLVIAAVAFFIIKKRSAVSQNK